MAVDEAFDTVEPCGSCRLEKIEREVGSTPTSDGRAVYQPVTSLTGGLVGANGARIDHCNRVATASGDGRVGGRDRQGRGRPDL
jgi:hypothetical protein